MSLGLGLLHKMLTTNTAVSVLGENGITRDDFLPDEQKVLDFVVNHYSSFNSLPKIQTVEVETEVSFPDFPSEPIGYWIQEVEKRQRLRMLLSASKEIQNEVQGRHVENAIERVRDVYVSLQRRGAVESLDVLSHVAEQVLEVHDKLQMSSGMSGIPFGFDYLDGVSDGAQGGDTVAIVGRPGAGKSFLMLHMANHAYVHGARPLFATFEMPPKQCVRRILALRTHVPTTMIRLGRMSHWHRERVANDVGSLRSMEDRPFYIVRGSLRSTVEDLVIRIQELRPTVLYVDGAYLLRTKKGGGSARWERVAETAEVLKMIASDFNIPVVASYQFNRRGGGSLANIAGADVIGQLASIVIGIDEEDADSSMSFAASQAKLLELLKGREGERGTIRISFDMQAMRIEELEVLGGNVLPRVEEGL